MDKIFILNQSYPNPKSGDVGSAFVHVRAKFYAEDFDVEVVKITATEESYVYENIMVTCCKSYPLFLEYLKANRPKIILTHFCESWMNTAAVNNNIPIIIWVHGSEAHSWYRILFNIHRGNLIGFAKFMLINTISLRNFHRLIKLSKNSTKIHFVFVSDWMRRITFTDTFASTSEYSIIPNPIDTKLFKFVDKPAELRKKILMIRSFNSSKYANDISMEAILQLSKKTYFNELEFTIYGKGVHWEKLTSKIAHLKNVKLINKLVPQSEIPDLHQQHGIFLCPTRMDAQGVSMCEAMSSGLVPITSNNTAIPEFVKNKVSGFVTDSVSDIVRAVEFIYENPDSFSKMSSQASSQIAEQCGTEKIISKEKELIRKLMVTV
jgi:glycosyltransferase involved in cell wall biosynthesis